MKLLTINYEGFVGKDKVFNVECRILKYHLTVKDPRIITELADRRGATSFDIDKLFRTAEEKLSKYLPK